jgi:hypothetical protein
MSDVSTFKRGQVIWAVWRAFSHLGQDPRPEQVPTTFKTRVRKMGELGVPLSEKEKPGQSGIDIEYTAYNAFELAVALTCQDTGLKQSEVAFFMRHSRPALRACYERIMASPPSPGMQILGRDRPNSPTRMVVQAPDPKGLGDPSRSNVADTSCFMSFRYVEIREAWSNLKFKSSDWGGKGEHPFFFVPKFHYGLVELAKEMDWIAAAYQDNIRIVIELSNLAVIVTESLTRAPEIRRGRQ